MTTPVSPGDVLLGTYRVERVLGKGGMGVVVAARHIRLGELFAIKFLLPEALAHPDAVQRFFREAQASARLKGEHAVRVHDVGHLPDGLPYMVMEHLSGSDLREVVMQRGPLPLMEAVTYVLQACEALAEAHSLGIVHRDLKPGNMFLTRRPNGSPCVKVLDFGISKQLMPEDAEQQVLTQTGMVLGSPAYMSPEQMTRTKEADPRGDLWSMGVVLYQLLTGTVPFAADAFTELIGKVLQEDPVPPSRHRPDIPPAVDAVVMRCLRKRREERFKNTVELMDALRAALTASATPPHAPWGGGLSPQNTVPLFPSPAGPSAAGPPPPTAAFQAPARASAAGEMRPPQPSQPILVEGAVAPPRASLYSIPEHGAAEARPAWNAGVGGVGVAGQSAQTGQAWGTTENRPRAASPKAPYAVAIAVVVVLVLGFATALAIWQYRDQSDATAVATSAPAPTDSSSMTVAPTATPPNSPTAPAPTAAPAEPASASATTGAAPSALPPATRPAVTPAVKSTASATATANPKPATTAAPQSSPTPTTASSANPYKRD